MSEDFACTEVDAEQQEPSILHFTPVPREKDRTNGWKPHIQQRFIEALAETGSVAAACKRVGRSKDSVYQLRRHPEAESFRAAWDAALDMGARRIEDAAMDRALYGVEEEVIQNGETVLKRRRYNERLVMFMLRNRVPERFSEGGAMGLSAVDRMKLKRLKEQWRREWAEERAAREPSIEEVRAEIMRKVAAIDRHRRAEWTDFEHRLRAVWDAVQNARDVGVGDEHELRAVAAAYGLAELTTQPPALGSPEAAETPLAPDA